MYEGSIDKEKGEIYINSQDHLYIGHLEKWRSLVLPRHGICKRKINGLGLNIGDIATTSFNGDNYYINGEALFNTIDKIQNYVTFCTEERASCKVNTVPFFVEAVISGCSEIHIGDVFLVSGTKVNNYQVLFSSDKTVLGWTLTPRYYKKITPKYVVSKLGNLATYEIDTINYQQGYVDLKVGIGMERHTFNSLFDKFTITPEKEVKKEVHPIIWIEAGNGIIYRAQKNTIGYELVDLKEGFASNICKIVSEPKYCRRKEVSNAEFFKGYNYKINNILKTGVEVLNNEDSSIFYPFEEFNKLFEFISEKLYNTSKVENYVKSYGGTGRPLSSFDFNCCIQNVRRTGSDKVSFSLGSEIGLGKILGVEDFKDTIDYIQSISRQQYPLTPKDAFTPIDGIISGGIKNTKTVLKLNTKKSKKLDGKVYKMNLIN